MSSRHRDFGTPAEMNKEPVTFTLAGEEFTCLPEAPSGVLNDLVAGISVDERGNRVYSAPNLIAFVAGVLRDEQEMTVANAIEAGLYDPGNSDVDDEAMVIVATDDVPRFHRLVHDKRRVVPIDQLGELVMWLSEEMTNRPTQPPVRSPRGRR